MFRGKGLGDGLALRHRRWVGWAAACCAALAAFHVAGERIANAQMNFNHQPPQIRMPSAPSFRSHSFGAGALNLQHHQAARSQFPSFYRAARSAGAIKSPRSMFSNRAWTRHPSTVGIAERVGLQTRQSKQGYRGGGPKVSRKPDLSGKISQRQSEQPKKPTRGSATTWLEKFGNPKKPTRGPETAWQDKFGNSKKFGLQKLPRGDSKRLDLQKLPRGDSKKLDLQKFPKGKAMQSGNSRPSRSVGSKTFGTGSMNTNERLGSSTNQKLERMQSRMRPAPQMKSSTQPKQWRSQRFLFPRLRR